MNANGTSKDDTPASAAGRVSSVRYERQQRAGCQLNHR